MTSTNPTVSKAFETLFKYARLRRLFHEDEGVIGCGWFAKDPDNPHHVLANVLRVFVALFFAPIYILIPHNYAGSVKEFLKQAAWFIEYSNTPHAILRSSPMGGVGKYSPTGTYPRWLLRVRYDHQGFFESNQIPWSEKPLGVTYNAISYAMSCAKVLFDEAGMELLDPQPADGRTYSLTDRKRISKCVLREYVAARLRQGGEPVRTQDPVKTEYIWLDEFCLSSNGINDPQVEEEERNNEVGLLADIFSGAENVCVFCDVVNCEHVDLTCKWNQRLFTLAEILHCRNVLVLTRRKEGDGPLVTRATFNYGDQFRRRIQFEAARESQWHLYAVMQHSTNAGAASWQAVIHSLVVEAIRRDEADNFHNHNFLGKGLNGLLPRRSRLGDLRGKDGWQDLAWLLELNQGFYNAASLAAICSLANPNVPSYRWWGKPISPAEGNERLEPLVTAFPVQYIMSSGALQPTLCIVHPKRIPIRQKLRRDGAALYNNEEMDVLRRLCWWIFPVLSLIFGGSLFGTSHFGGGFAIIYTFCILYSMLDLAASTAFVIREGWVYSDAAGWPDAIDWVKSQDPNFAEFTNWGNNQLCPKWEAPLKRKREGDKEEGNKEGEEKVSWPAFLIDLQSKVIVSTTVIDHPNDLVVLALHGCGMTSMLLKREFKGNTVAQKVGMVNLPPYVLAQALESGTVYVGGAPS